MDLRTRRLVRAQPDETVCALSLDWFVFGATFGLPGATSANVGESRTNEWDPIRLEVPQLADSWPAELLRYCFVWVSIQAS